MESVLYLSDHDRSRYKRDIVNYQWIFDNKLFPAFSDIESEANQVENEKLKELESNFNPEGFLDGSDIAGMAHDAGFERYLLLKLGEYNLFCSTVSTLYHLWEQQLRVYLYEEISDTFIIEFRKFAEDFGELKKVFMAHDVDITTFISWSKLKELRLLNNYIKHGPGSSEVKLRKHAPKYFEDLYTGDPAWILSKTTLLDTTININKNDVDELFKAVVDFWDQLPESAYLKEELLNEITKLGKNGK